METEVRVSQVDESARATSERVAQAVSPEILFKEGLQTIVSGLGALYVVSVLSHARLGEGLTSTTLWMVAVGAGVFLGLRWAFGRWTLQSRWTEFLGVGVGILILLNSVFHFYLGAGNGSTVANLALTSAGITCFLLPMRRLVWYIAGAVIVQAVFAWLGGPMVPWLHFSYGMFAASGLKLYSEFRRAQLHTAFNEVSAEISKRCEVEASLLRSEERYALVSRATNDGIWDWNLRSGDIYYSARWQKMLGYEPNELENNPDEWFKRIHPDDEARIREAISSQISGASDHINCDYRIRHKDGSYKWMLCRGMTVKDEKDRRHRLIGAQTDITDRKINEEQLIHEALHDPLTRLPNRAYLTERLWDALKIVKGRPNYLFALLFMDLDCFKKINDSLGHVAGDSLLKLTARRLQNCVRPRDIVARLGGDEFAILLDEISDFTEATRIADRIQKKLTLPVDIHGREVFSSVSIGIVFGTADYGCPEDLLRDADAAMYRAKDRGSSGCKVFDDQMSAEAAAVVKLEKDIRRAFEQGEFRLLYQPIVSLDTGKIVGVESLLRWKHPNRGLLTPDHFLSATEETGLIVPIGWWTLREACRKAAHWQRRFPHCLPLTVSINLSARQVAQPDLLDQIDRALEESELDPRLLGLEVTEDAIIHNDQSPVEAFHKVHERGVRLHLDDFGTGYSSLSYLNQLPLDAAKIDRSFISGLPSDSQKLRLVRTMVELLHNLGIKIIVEGVEVSEQLERVKQLKCQYGQGFYFSDPLESEELELLLGQSGHHWNSSDGPGLEMPARIN